MIERIVYIDAKKAVAEAMKNSTFALGMSIAAQAKLLAPVDQGQLRNSISVVSHEKEALLNDRQGERAPSLNKTALGERDVYVGSNVDHAIFQEYGTVKQPAQPFLRPARELIDGGDVAEIMKKYSREAMEALFSIRKVLRGV